MLKNKLPIMMIIIMTASGCMIKDGKYVSDNPVEEIAEAVLDSKTGLDIDFTPGTPEK